MRRKRHQCVLIGGMREDYCITHDGRAISGVMGGNAVYAAVGAKLWTENVQIVSRVGKNYPATWLAQLDARGISTSSVRILDHDLDTRTFYAYQSLEKRVDTNPPAHYARWDLPFPEALNGYSSSTEGQGDRTEPSISTIQPGDLPPSLLQTIVAAHLSPADYLTHLTIPSLLSQHGVEIVTLDPSIRYMTPAFARDLPVLLDGITAFLPSVLEASSFVAGKVSDTWKFTEYFHTMGPEIVVIKAGSEGQYISHASQGKRWHIPAYPSEVKDVTGAGDAFCGAFMIGLCETGDPLEAALRGNIAASFVLEGSGAQYALDTPKSLIEARLGELRRMVREE